jgi:pimeloyl-ACP methyl ester carboxylesterase
MSQHMADDTIGLMDHLAIEKANILGVSMGGMIAQEIAINYPSRVTRLVLASTYCCQDNESNGATEETVNAAQTPYDKEIVTLINLAFDKRFNRLFFRFLVRLGNAFSSASNKALNRAGIMSQTLPMGRTMP